MSSDASASGQTSLFAHTDKNSTHEISLVPQPTQKRLNQRQETDYRLHRKNLLQWTLSEGKKPHKKEGYSTETIKPYYNRHDVVFRWVWRQEDGYTKQVTTEHANEYVKLLANSDEYSEYHKSGCVKALNIYFKWKRHEKGGNGWESPITFSPGDHQPQDYLTLKERIKIREAVLEYQTVPEYDSLTPKERDEHRAYLAQRLGKKKSEIDRRDWERANDWKYPSLVGASLDAGLRPIEVQRASVDWVDYQNGILRIPKEESSKNRENWKVVLKEDTTKALKRWLEDRQKYPEYQDTDALWLTRFENRYDSAALCDVLVDLCEIAGIETENRKMTWYSIRHSTGTYMTHEEDLGAASVQLRHKSKQTTMKYDHAPPEVRKQALEKMG
jgi:integrase